MGVRLGGLAFCQSVLEPFHEDLRSVPIVAWSRYRAIPDRLPFDKNKDRARERCLGVYARRGSSTPRRPRHRPARHV